VNHPARQRRRLSAAPDEEISRHNLNLIMQQQSLNLTPSRHKNIIPVALHKDLITTTCELVLNQHAGALPDLSHISILLSNANLAQQCHLTLLRSANARGHTALLGPTIGTLEGWLETNASIEHTTVSEHARELLLVEALSEYPHIYGQGSPWMLAESLMELFDELTKYHIHLPASQAAFTQQIAEAYGRHEVNFSALSKESYLVHTLWTAIHQQLSDAGLVDQNTAHIVKLASSITQLADQHIIYYCGIPPTTPAHQQWQQTLLEKNQLYVISHEPGTINGSPNETSDKVPSDNFDNNADNTTDITAEKSAYHQYLQQVYAYQQDTFIARATQCKLQYESSPIQPFIQAYSASDTEDEALAIDIQVRRWLIQGKNNIGIVTENRKLARRIRALLERANISLDDSAGWALSTTSAATVIERWLETVEEDFHHVPLLDFLKSPFLQLTENNEAFLKTVYHFEQGIVINENVASGIDRYLANISFRQQRLPTDLAQQYTPIVAILNQLAQAAAPLTQLLEGDNHHPSLFINGLLDSLQHFNITQRLSEDDAGQQLLQEITQMKQAAHHTGLTMDWIAFRNWLGQTLERFNFKPSHHASNVKLVALTNSELYCFDGLIFASAERDNFPPLIKQSPFFNNAVRAALGIPTLQEKSSINFYYYRRLLASINPETGRQGAILFTRRLKDNDEDIIPSPWLEVLLAFHQFTHETNLGSNKLPYYIESPNARVIKDSTPMPEPVFANPSVIVNKQLIPKVLSASAYQQLLNCPYQFFAARCLKLSPPESVREFLQKSDYGERIHLCLQAFHSNVDGLPGPVTTPIKPENRQAAASLLNEIANVVFSKDIEDNFLHRGWLKRWQTSIQSYIDWQIAHQGTWRIKDVEIDISGASLDSLTKISGRIDRIDSGTDTSTAALNVIDYKTGRLPSKEDVESGEAIQLPFYLSLLEASHYDFFNQSTGQLPVDNAAPKETMVKVEYLDLSEPNVASKVQLEAETLLTLKMQSEVRLRDIMQGMHRGEKLSAWGDSSTCRYCQMEGLCRKQVWSDPTTNE